MKRKRIEAWGEVQDGRLLAVHSDREVVASWADSDAMYGPVQVVRLVEHSPAEAAIVRAAVRWRLNEERESTLLTVERKFEIALRKAVHQFQRERKRKVAP